MIERLLSNLYRSFDKSSYDVIALRVSHADGFSWNVNNRLLIAATETGLVLSEIDLRAVTIKQLSDVLISIGCVVTFINPDTEGRLAIALLNGSGNESFANGDALRIYDSLLWSYLGSYGIELDSAGDQISNALSDINYSTATGEFLDFWGQFWGIPRLAGESDTDYRDRTIWEIMTPKVNPVAMSAVAYRITQRNIEMYEPWKSLFVLSESHLDREILYDGLNWSPYVYRPTLVGGDNIDWLPVLSLLEKLRPAGVFGLYPDWQSKRELSIYSGNAPKLGLGQMQMNVSMLSLSDKALLDDYHLGDVIVQNYLINSLTVISLSNAILNYWDGPWNAHAWTDHIFGGIPEPYTIASNRHFVRSQIVLSDMDYGFGSEQFTFPGGATIYLNTAYLGEFALSEFNNGAMHVSFEEMLVSDIGFEVTASFPIAQLNTAYSSNIILHAVMGSELNTTYSSNIILHAVRGSDAFIPTDFLGIENYGWFGSWDTRNWVEDVFISNHGWFGPWNTKNWVTDWVADSVLLLMSGNCSRIKITTSLA